MVLNCFYEKNYHFFWKCKCDCGNEKFVEYSKLVSGHTKSCGCLQKERTSLARQKQNKFKIVSEYCYLYDDNKNETIIDSEDFERVKKFFWRKNSQGYWTAFNKETEFPKTIRLHNLIVFGDDYLKHYSSSLMCDHKNGNRSDNRKFNLRISSKNLNNKNTKIRKDNKTGYTGIFCKNNKWIAYIDSNKTRNRFTCDSKEEAVLTRKIAEAILHKNYAKSLNREELCLQENDKIKISNCIKKVRKKLKNYLDYESWIFKDYDSIQESDR